MYRAGKWAKAATQLEEARRLNGKGGSSWQNLFLAMAYHRLGNTKESDRATLARDADWTQRLIYRWLRHEAETVRKSTPRPGK